MRPPPAPRHEPRGHRTDVAKALDYLLRVSKRRAIVFVVSDFLSPDFSRPLAAVYRKNKMLSPAMKEFLNLLKAGSGEESKKAFKPLNREP